MTTLLLADDHTLMRELLKTQLKTFCGEQGEIFEASSYKEVLAYADRDPPVSLDAILLDLNMPGSLEHDVTAAAGTIIRRFEPTPVVVFSGTFKVDIVTAIMRAGARGFIPKTTQPKSFLAGLRAVLDGHIYVPPELIELLAEAQPKAPGTDLTDREQTVLSLLLGGRSNKEIARELGVQEITVKVHLKSTFAKLGAANRVEAARIALERGLVGPLADSH